MRRIAAALLLATALGGASRGEPPTSPSGSRSAVAVLPSGLELALEIAADDASRARGYMGRETVGRREGMLFLFDRSERYPFWMKNCKVSLDIVWLDERLRVVDIAFDRPPCPEEGPCPEVSPILPARFVLEMAGGTAKAERLARGDSIVILSDPPLVR